ncbi:hypothetical protein LGH70_20655 [Hymenobacter sp. BT635]|uniref:Glycosyltransferase RgtA/B/C/D-like domain-containing protein n=1 Tax=Hymenobacter nitidus TaxID=2880929 RepID=A0ABS8AJ43_9BACT|nr:hypothetical protein [Hymenobacter nitidus]MCB2380017.1 hypothetical protein [Hymenobacter nitidus]
MLLSESQLNHPVVQPIRGVLQRSTTIFLAIALHAVLLVVAYSVLYAFGVIQQLPTDQRLLTWDANLFHNLSQTGYDQATSGINAFFPLLPLVWHYTNMSAISVSILNACCTWVGVGLLAWSFQLSFRQILVALSAPMLFFGLVPYAEAFFFFFSTIMLVGLHQRKHGLVLVGLFLACLSRSAATLFVPAYLFAELLWWSRSAKLASLLRIITGLLAILTAVGGVMLAQYKSHGDAFAFFKVHDKLWGHKIRLPDVVLFSSGGFNILWLDAFALIISFICFISCAVLGIRWLKKSNPAEGAFPSKAVLFSMGYCVGAAFFIIFYQGGDLVGMARYVLASPFFVVLLWWCWTMPAPQQRKLLGIVVGTGLAVIVCMGGVWRFTSFYPGQAVVYFTLFLLYVVVYLAVSPNAARWYREAATGLYIVNVLLMVYLFVLFMQGIWIN